MFIPEVCGVETGFLAFVAGPDLVGLELSLDLPVKTMVKYSRDNKTPTKLDYLTQECVICVIDLQLD